MKSFPLKKFIELQVLKGSLGLTGWKLALTKIALRYALKYLTRLQNWAINKALNHTREERSFEAKKDFQKQKEKQIKEAGGKFL